jgi:phosphonate transport system ATP-binding protein
VVFDDVPAALTDEAARELYGMEADEAIGASPVPALPDAAVTVPAGA